MSDNVAVTAGTGTSIATDQIGTDHYQRVKLDIGAEGVASGPVCTANPLPVHDAGGSLTVDGPLTDTQLRLTSVPVAEAGAALTALQLIDDLAVTEGTVNATIKGAPILWEDTGDTLRVPSAAKPFPVAIITGAGSGGTAMTDDAAFTVATTSVTPIAGVYKSSMDSVDDGDGGAVHMTIKRGLHTSIYTPLGDSAMNDSTNAVNVHIVGDDVGSAVDNEDGTVAVGSTNVAMVINTSYEYDGTNHVRTVGPHTVAHDAADAGNPEKLGAKATSSVSAQTLVATADRTNVVAGLDGVLLTRPHCNLEDIVSGNASNTDGTSTQCIAAQAAGIKTYLTTIIVVNTHASTDTQVDIKDGVTVKATVPVPHASGVVVNLPVPLPGTAATAWNFDQAHTVTTIICTMIGFKSKV